MSLTSTFSLDRQLLYVHVNLLLFKKAVSLRRSIIYIWYMSLILWLVGCSFIIPIRCLDFFCLQLQQIHWFYGNEWLNILMCQNNQCLPFVICRVPCDLCSLCKCIFIYITVYFKVPLTFLCLADNEFLKFMYTYTYFLYSVHSNKLLDVVLQSVLHALLNFVPQMNTVVPLLGCFLLESRYHL